MQHVSSRPQVFKNLYTLVRHIPAAFQFFVSHLIAVDIQCPETSVGTIYSVLAGRRGQIAREEQRIGTPVFTLKAYVPVAESFGLNKEISKVTGGTAFIQCLFDHWDAVDGSLVEKGSKVEELVRSLRVRNGLKVCFLEACSCDPFG